MPHVPVDRSHEVETLKREYNLHPDVVAAMEDEPNRNQFVNRLLAEHYGLDAKRIVYELPKRGKRARPVDPDVIKDDDKVGSL